MTRLEKSILRHRVLILFLYVLMILWVVWSCIYIHWIAGAWPLLLSILVSQCVFKKFNLYIPRTDYFKICRKLSKEERRQLSDQCYSDSEFPRIGEIAFTQKLVVFVKLGAVVSYDQIKNITCEKWRVGLSSSKSFAYIIVIEKKNNKRVRCEIYNDDSLFVGENSAFEKAMEFYRIRKEACTKKSDSENWLNT